MIDRTEFKRLFGKFTYWQVDMECGFNEEEIWKNLKKRYSSKFLSDKEITQIHRKTDKVIAVILELKSQFNVTKRQTEKRGWIKK